VFFSYYLEVLEILLKLILFVVVLVVADAEMLSVSATSTKPHEFINLQPARPLLQVYN